jgi:hypothetical protein
VVVLILLLMSIGMIVMEMDWGMVILGNIAT